MYRNKKFHNCAFTATVHVHVLMSFLTELCCVVQLFVNSYLTLCTPLIRTSRSLHMCRAIHPPPVLSFVIVCVLSRSFLRLCKSLLISFNHFSQYTCNISLNHYSLFHRQFTEYVCLHAHACTRSLTTDVMYSKHINFYIVYTS